MKAERESRSIRWNLASVWMGCSERQEGPADRLDRLVTVFLALSHHSKSSRKYFSVTPVQASCQTEVRNTDES